MIQNLSSAMEAEQDLHIAKHIEPENLPAIRLTRYSTNSWNARMAAGTSTRVRDRLLPMYGVRP